MIASSHDLPPRGNYFAEDAYLTQDLAAGTLHNRAGARLVALSDDFILATLNTLQTELGAQADGVVKALGHDWGRRAAEQFAAEIEKYRGRPLRQLPLALFAADLAEAFRHHGWGAFRFDFSRYPQGLLTVDVSDPVVGSAIKPVWTPAEGLLGAFLAGMFSHFAGVDLDCVQTECRGCGAAQARFVLTVPERLADVSAGPGRTHEAVIEELCRR